MRSATCCARALAGMLLLSVPPAAVTQPTPQAAGLGEAVEVEVVQVDAVVTDPQGRPLTDLGPGDFRVYEDGRRVKITHFTAPAVPAAPQGEPAAATAPAPEAGSGGSQRLESSAAAPGSLVLFVDNRALRPQDRNRVLAETLGFLRPRMDGRLQVMVVTYDGGLHLRQPFTTDPALVESVVAEVMELAGSHFTQDAEFRLVERSLDDLLRRFNDSFVASGLASRGQSAGAPQEFTVSSELDSVLSEVRSYAQRLHRETLGSIGALAGFVNALSLAEGRKALVYVGDGLPVRPGEELFVAVQERLDGGRVLTERLARQSEEAGGGGNALGEANLQHRQLTDVATLRSEAQQFDVRPQLEQLGDLANSNRVTFYAIDAAGARPALPGADVDGSVAGATTAVETALVREGNLQESLRTLAVSTGGLALLGGNDVDGLLARTLDDLGASYSLGYVPDHGPDARYHELRVEVDRSGAEVRYRRGYLHKTRRLALADRVTSVLLLGGGENPLEVRLVIGEPVADGTGNFAVPVQAQIPVDRLAFEPRQDLVVCGLRVLVSYQDPQGRLHPAREVPVAIRYTPEQLEANRGRVYPVPFKIRAAAGEHRLAVAVWEEREGVTSFVSRPFTVEEDRD